MKKIRFVDEIELLMTKPKDFRKVVERLRRKERLRMEKEKNLEAIRLLEKGVFHGRKINKDDTWSE